MNFNLNGVPQTLRRGSSAFLLVGSLLSISSVSDAASNVEQLFLQEHLDLNQTFNNSMWAGTHNSFNSEEWNTAYNADPNQDLSPRDQLRSGVRELVFDVNDFGTQLLLCHGGCAGIEKKFRDGLEQIRNWLEEDQGHLESVILLKIEINTSNNGQVADQLRDELGDYLYEATHSGSGSGVCKGLPADTLTKRDVLRAGKNVVVVTTGENCHTSQDFKEVIHVGIDYANGSNDSRFEKPSEPEDCLANTTGTNKLMTRLADISTLYGIAGDDPEDKKITESNVADYLACGLNIFEMFWFNGDNKVGHLEPADLVWSWNGSEPNNYSGNEDCAASISNGMFNDASCENVYQFACRTDEGWKITLSSGAWSQGQAMCNSEFSSNYGVYDFDVPFNGYDNQQLIAAKASAGVSTAWLGYHDQSLEGFWQRGSEQSQVTEVVTVSSAGGNNGSDFDDFSQVKLALHENGQRYPTQMWIYAGSRVTQVGVDYSDGRTVKHGTKDNNPHETLSLSASEYVTSVKRCISPKGGEDRVYYLQLTTNKGNSIDGGTNNKGSCTTTTYSDKRLMAFHGNFGDKAYAIGYHFLGLPN